MNKYFVSDSSTNALTSEAAFASQNVMAKFWTRVTTYNKS